MLMINFQPYTCHILEECDNYVVVNLKHNRSPFLEVGNCDVVNVTSLKFFKTLSGCIT